MYDVYLIVYVKCDTPGAPSGVRPSLNSRFFILFISINIMIKNVDMKIDKFNRSSRSSLFNRSSFTIKITGKGKPILLVVNNCWKRAM